MKRFVSTLAALMLLALVSWGAFWVLRVFWKGLVSLQPSLASALIAGSTTVVVAVLTIVIGRYYERKKEIENQQRARKIEIYEEFLEVWFNRLLGQRHQSDSQPLVNDDEFVQFLVEFTRKLILWGSDEVVKSYYEFRRKGISEKSEGSIALLLQFEQLLFAIRKDIGHANHTLNKGDLLTLFLNDFRIE